MIRPTNTAEKIENEALIELRSLFKKRLATTYQGKQYWAHPVFRQTVFSNVQASDLEEIDLGEGYVLLYRENKPFFSHGLGRYIITYQIGLKNDVTTP